MKLRIRTLTFVILGIFLFSFFPTADAQAAPPDPISTTETWTTDRMLDGSLNITETGHLTIASGVTITFTCAADKMNPYFLTVNSGGQLSADGVTFQGDGTAGCWGGIMILSGDNQTVIENSTIRDVWAGITISDSSPTISNNEIYNIQAPDNLNPGAGGFSAAGITIMSSTVATTPIIQDNHIHHITGGAGAAGANGAHATEAGTAGENGENGGNGGEAYGIKVEGINTDALIQGNTIEYLTSGNCGVGGNGGDGAAGADSVNGIGPGGMGGEGGGGGQGGVPGTAYGIYAYGTGDTQIIDNEIAYLAQPNACPGGDGGMGGAGGRGGDGDDVNSISGSSGGMGGTGGHGGASGRGFFGVVGIQVTYPEGEETTHDKISQNVLHDFTAGDGVPGGMAQSGGPGGIGGNASPSSPLGNGDGGVGGIGGQGGNGGSNNGGFYAAGILVQNVSISIDSNTIYNIQAGDGGIGEVAGDGGNGGVGGIGGYYTLGEVYGNGGEGGPGGWGGQGGWGGNGGAAGGIYVAGEELLSVTAEVFNNDIWGINGGMGGGAGSSGIGGIGGNGGNTLSPTQGTGGDGGDGGQGGPNSGGGNSGRSFSIMLADANGNVYNNTLVDVVAAETGGSVGSGGTGGTGGLGGEGGTPGTDGADGPTGPTDHGSSGNGNMAIGIVFMQYEESLTNVYNNIFYLSDSTPENTYAVTEHGLAFASLDYNDIYGWNNTNYTTPNGTNSIFSDPLFVSADDHDLQAGSPCIDTGNNTGAPSKDINGLPRPIDGDGIGSAIVDMGAFEAMTSGFMIFVPLLTQ